VQFQNSGRPYPHFDTTAAGNLQTQQKTSHHAHDWHIVSGKGVDQLLGSINPVEVTTPVAGKMSTDMAGGRYRQQNYAHPDDLYYDDDERQQGVNQQGYYANQPVSLPSLDDSSCHMLTT
jgi:hypothetical protein